MTDETEKIKQLEQSLANAENSLFGLLSAIKFHSGEDHGIMGVRKMVDKIKELERERDGLEARATAAEAKVAELGQKLREARDYVVVARDAYVKHPANERRIAIEQKFIDEIDAALNNK